MQLVLEQDTILLFLGRRVNVPGASPFPGITENFIMRIIATIDGDVSPTHRSTKDKEDSEDKFQQCLHRKAAQKRELMLRRPECDPPCRVAPGIYIGGVGAARDLEKLQRFGITHVLNASPIVPCFHRKYLRYKNVDVFDDEEENIMQYFMSSSAYITKGIQKGGAVLIHCYAGQSRSSALVMAHLIITQGITVEAALHCLRVVRPCAEPNPGFLRQLEQFANHTLPPPGGYVDVSRQQPADSMPHEV